MKLASLPLIDRDSHNLSAIAISALASRRYRPHSGGGGRHRKKPAQADVVDAGCWRISHVRCRGRHSGDGTSRGAGAIAKGLLLVFHISQRDQGHQNFAQHTLDCTSSSETAKIRRLARQLLRRHSTGSTPTWRTTN